MSDASAYAFACCLLIGGLAIEREILQLAGEEGDVSKYDVREQC